MRRRDFLQAGMAGSVGSLMQGHRAPAGPRDEPLPSPDRRPDVIYKGTPPEVVEAMIRLADPKRDEVVYDLGCGDGRILIAAARRFGVRAVGVDLEPKWVRAAEENARRAGVDHLVTFRREDFFTTDLRPASVVFLYLLPTLNERLLPRLARLRYGARVVSHSFAMRGARPTRTVRVETPDGARRTVFLWEVPWEKE